jgi:hypothetical protein
LVLLVVVISVVVKFVVVTFGWLHLFPVGSPCWFIHVVVRCLPFLTLLLRTLLHVCRVGCWFAAVTVLLLVLFTVVGWLLLRYVPYVRSPRLVGYRLLFAGYVWLPLVYSLRLLPHCLLRLIRWLIVDVDYTVVGWLRFGYVTFVGCYVRLLLRCCSTTLFVVVDRYCWLFVVPYLLVLRYPLDVGYL